MRRFVVEVLVDVFALSVIILVLNFITVPQPFPFGRDKAPIAAARSAGILGFLSWAAIVVVVNRFARPVLVAFTGRLLFSTMGFFVVIINAIAIYITAFFAPIKIATVAQPTILWVIVAAAMYTLLSTATDMVLRLNRPSLDPERNRNIWGFLERLPTPRRNLILENMRLQQVYKGRSWSWPSIIRSWLTGRRPHSGRRVRRRWGQPSPDKSRNSIRPSWL